VKLTTSDLCKLEAIKMKIKIPGKKWNLENNKYSFKIKRNRKKGRTGIK